MILASSPTLVSGLFDSLTAVGFALAKCWRHPSFRGNRNDKPGVLDQELDKFALLLLNALEAFDPERKVLVPSPFTIVPGRHGPGLAIADGRREPTYIGELIANFQRIVPSLELFSIYASEGPSKYFEPRADMVAWDRWRFERPALSTFIEQFVDLIAEFKERELIAFGRHPTPRDSRAALRYLHRKFREELSRFLSSCEAGGVIHPEGAFRLREAYSVAKSAYAKVSEDGQHYSDVRSRIIGSPDGDARDAAIECRRGWDEICRPVEWRQLAPKSRALYRLVCVVVSALQSSGKCADGQSLPDVPELQVAHADWQSEGASQGCEMPIDELRKGEIDRSGPRIEVCIDGVLNSSFCDP